MMYCQEENEKQETTSPPKYMVVTPMSTYTVNEHTFQKANNSLFFCNGLMKHSNLLR